MANAYISVAGIKQAAALNIQGTAYDTRLRQLAENVSRQVDRYCNRVFFFYTEIKEFSGEGSPRLHIPDLIAVTTLKEDSNSDGTFDTTWAAADYNKEPANSQPTADWGHGFTRLEVNIRSNGSQDVFIKDQRNYEITGTWGYRRVIEDSLNTGTLTTGTSTALILSGTANLEVGQTLVLESEQVYLIGIAAGTGTVERAKNGSTGTAHIAAGGIAVNIVRYPGPIQEAVLIQTARLWKRKDSGFATQVGIPETGQMEIFVGGLDSDVKALLNPFRKIPLGIGI